MWYQSGMSILLPSAWGLSGKDGLSRGGLLGISTTRTTLSAVHEHVPVTLVGAYRQRWSLLGGGGLPGISAQNKYGSQVCMLHYHTKMVRLTRQLLLKLLPPTPKKYQYLAIPVPNRNLG
mmetsp:Transcript_95328/g.153736  ORF Transcript_95328/g.153736 Transcript_95328/m.153736 type:complete len:120 (+) Transcript_95328:923-1282(+)